MVIIYWGSVNIWGKMKGFNFITPLVATWYILYPAPLYEHIFVIKHLPHICVRNRFL